MPHIAPSVSPLGDAVSLFKLDHSVTSGDRLEPKSGTKKTQPSSGNSNGLDRQFFFKKAKRRRGETHYDKGQAKGIQKTECCPKVGEEARGTGMPESLVGEHREKETQQDQYQRCEVSQWVRGGRGCGWTVNGQRNKGRDQWTGLSCDMSEGSRKQGH